ncbi:MAG: hypothetical protein WC372_07155 [Candidatus Neomarinimicrobiota bacterium]|jgi:hypothetical protein|nr:hypothetical protein [Candidatus Neomarinimicrobiota bacterium]MDD3965906.1 hypothetical protein [Candidatus Neomarinimicrobiota bacterium]MDX9780810.1 hypothetical protein [bacterium]
MKHKNSIMIFFLLLALLLPRMLPAQWQLSVRAEAGAHNASEGMYLRSAAAVQYRLKDTEFSAGLQFELFGKVPRHFSGLNLGISQAMAIREFPFEVAAFFLHRPYSDLQYENSWGLLAETDYRHFHFMFGNGFRAFRLTRQAVQDYPEGAGTLIRENWNLLYRIGYDLKSEDNFWNAGIAVTNLDYFLMNQETNPMLLLHGNAEIASGLDLYAEFWYKQAGVFNISANYFGYFFRLGVLWEL